jgi:hypothetical protein
MDKSNTGILAHYMLPSARLKLDKFYRLRLAKYIFAEQYRHDDDDLGAFYRMWTGTG